MSTLITIGKTKCVVPESDVLKKCLFFFVKIRAVVGSWLPVFQLRLFSKMLCLPSWSFRFRKKWHDAICLWFDVLKVKVGMMLTEFIVLIQRRGLKVNL